MDSTPFPELATLTSTSLLEGLKDMHNETRWRQYVDRYRPLIESYARQRGLQASDAEDLAQTVLLEFSRAYRGGKYDRNRGRLRSWMFGIVYRQLQNDRRRKARRRERPVSDTEQAEVFEQLASINELEQAWQEEWQQAVLRQCIEEVRREVQPQTYLAFEQFALRGLPAEEVAQALGMTSNAVFSAKRRVMRRIRDLKPLLESIW